MTVDQVMFYHCQGWPILGNTALGMSVRATLVSCCKEVRDPMERPQVGIIADSPAKAQAGSQNQPPANV